MVKHIKSLMPKLSIFLGIVFLFFGIVPIIIYNIKHIGVIITLIAGVILIMLPFITRKSGQSKRKLLRILKVILLVLVILGLVIGAIFEIMILSVASRKTLSANTVIVLGCQVRNDTPSLMLSKRINAAFEYLQQNPKAFCVATGGVGTNSIIAEGTVIKRELVAMGIDEKRIFIEDTSTNTIENIENANKIINDKKLDKDIVIVSDSFHQYRAAWYARENGLNPYAKNAKTPWSLWFTYSVREMGGIGMLLLSIG